MSPRVPWASREPCFPFGVLCVVARRYSCHGICSARPRMSGRIASFVPWLRISATCLPSSNYRFSYRFFCLRAEASVRAEWLTPYTEAVSPDAAGPADCPISTASVLESRTRPNFKAKFFRVDECIPGS